MLGGESPSELLVARMVRIINHEMIPKNKINVPAENRKRDVFTVGDLMFVRDFPIAYSWTGDVTAGDVTNNFS